MAVKQTVSTELQQFGYSITFSGHDLRKGGGTLAIASELVSEDESITINQPMIVEQIAQLRIDEPEMVAEADRVLRKICDYLFLKQKGNNDGNSSQA